MKKLKLTGAAREFCNRHWQRCIDDGSLNDATVDLFELLCITRGMLSELEPDSKNFVISYIGLSKNFERQGIPFGITSKRRVERPKDLAAIIAEGLKDEI